MNAVGIPVVYGGEDVNDSTFRDKVKPVPGSVLYCDLFVAVEHSGIYVNDGKIANVEVDGIADSSVQLSDPKSFTSKSMMGSKIYVSCDSHGAVGHKSVARGAARTIGQRLFYGLLIKNCHQFSTRCVNCIGGEVKRSWFDRIFSYIPGETLEPTLRILKKTAEKKLGATKWRLWDWENENDDSDEEKDDNEAKEPHWDEHENAFKNVPLNAHNIAEIRKELEKTKDYEAEISDENIPSHIREKLAHFRITLNDISNKYDEAKLFLTALSGADFSYHDLINMTEDFSGLAKTLQSNQKIKELAHKMGRNYIAEEKKKKTKIPEASKNEIYGTHMSDEVMRLLPSELIYLEDETTETLFYAKLLEKNLQTYQLSGINMIDSETTEETQKRTGPVVACLDTSGSMAGDRMLKAKASLLAIGNILKTEDRSLYVLLFGSTGEIREFSMDKTNNAAELLKFLNQGFGSGTDFESPLKRACEIIQKSPDYKKADILMVSDGDCSLSPEFLKAFSKQKEILDCMVYSVLCGGTRITDQFSDEVLVL